MRRRSTHVLLALSAATALVVSGLAGAAGGATRVQGNGKSVTLNALFVRESSQGSEGGTNPVTIHLRRAGDRKSVV